MRKIFLIGSIVMLAVSGCGNSKELASANESLTAQVESLNAEKESMSEALDKAQKEKDSSENKLKAIQESIALVEAESKVQENDVTVKMIEKDSIPKDSSKWIFSNSCPMTFEVINNTDKDIQGVQGDLKVMDLFGSEILTAGCDFLGENIPAGGSIVSELSYEVNEFVSTDMKLFNTDFKDLKTEYTITKIVFADGTEKE